MKTITLITTEGEETTRTKKHLKAWDIPFKEIENLQNDETMLIVTNHGQSSCYNWKNINTRDKLWEIVKKEKEEQEKRKLKIKRITKPHTIGVNLTLESLARINVTIMRVMHGQNLSDIMNEWPENERAAGIILYRLTQHANASNLLTFAEMLENKAKTIDPWRK